MADDSPQKDIKLETLLKAAGNSFVDAQKALLPGMSTSVSMMLSKAELELKVTAGTDELGNVFVRPISSTEISSGNINPELISVLRFSFVGSVDDLKPRQQQPSSVAAEKTDPVPHILGLTSKEAETLLDLAKWRYEKHTAAMQDKPIVSARERVVRQLPASGQNAVREKTVVHFWIGLSDFSVKEIDGIGEKLGKILSKNGVETASDLIMSDVNRLATTLNMSETRVRDFVDMAVLMSSLAVMDSKDKVELLVKGANIHSVEQLAKADPDALYLTCKEAMDSGKVRVPNTFSLTLEEIREWTATAAGK